MGLASNDASPKGQGPPGVREGVKSILFLRDGEFGGDGDEKGGGREYACSDGA